MDITGSIDKENILYGIFVHPLFFYDMKRQAWSPLLVDYVASFASVCHTSLRSAVLFTGVHSAVGTIAVLTAFVPAALWSAGKKYGAAWSRITDAREEQKRSR